MDEQIVIWQFSVAMVILTIGCTLYSLGGYSGKWKRRFIGSFILSGGFNALCAWRGIWSPWLLTSFPILIGSFCLPYGADTLFPKLVKRASVVAAVLVSGLAFCLINGGNAWWVMVPHAGVGVWSIYLGVKNPIQSRAEEGFVCLFLCAGLMMYPFIGR